MSGGRLWFIHLLQLWVCSNQLLYRLRSVVDWWSLLLEAPLYEISLCVVQSLHLHARVWITASNILGVVETVCRCLWDDLVHADIKILSLLESWVVLPVPLELLLIRRWRSTWNKLVSSALWVLIILVLVETPFRWFLLLLLGAFIAFSVLMVEEIIIVFFEMLWGNSIWFLPAVAKEVSGVVGSVQVDILTLAVTIEILFDVAGAAAYGVTEHYLVRCHSSTHAASRLDWECFKTQVLVRILMPWRWAYLSVLHRWRLSMYRTWISSAHSSWILYMNAVVRCRVGLRQHVWMGLDRRLVHCSVALHMRVFILVLEVLVLLLLKVLLSLVTRRIESIYVVVPLVEEVYHPWSATAINVVSSSGSSALADSNILWSKLRHILHLQDSVLRRDELLDVPLLVSARLVCCAVELIVDAVVPTSCFWSGIFQTKCLVWLLLSAWWPLQLVVPDPSWYTNYFAEFTTGVSVHKLLILRQLALILPTNLLYRKLINHLSLKA